MLGDAFLAQQEELMDAVQRPRANVHGQAAQRNYNRAYGACMGGRGYQVR